MIKLKEFINYNRFPISEEKCPQCGGETVEDNFPPNYGHAGGSLEFSESGSLIKHICRACKIHFDVSHYEKHEKGKERIIKHDIFNIVPLVEKDGVYLTPNDVWREKYKDEHGQYPQEAYA